MRLASIAALAAAAVVALAAPATACSLDGATGPISSVISSVGSALGLKSPTPAATTTTATCTTCSACAGGSSAASGGATSTGSCSKGAVGSTAPAGGGSVTNNFVTNNFITNNAAGAEGAAGGAGGSSPQAVPFTFASGAKGGGGGGGAGGGGLGGFSGGSNAISGTPINPSSDLGPIMAGAGQSSGGAGEPIMLASVGDGDGSSYPGFGTVVSKPDAGDFTTPGISVAAVSADEPDGKNQPFIGMASPATNDTITAGAGFELDGTPASTGGSPTSRGTFVLAGLIGVAVVGAGWAWKSALM
jgi:hypothetical protein